MFQYFENSLNTARIYFILRLVSYVLHLLAVSRHPLLHSLLKALLALVEVFQTFSCDHSQLHCCALLRIELVNPFYRLSPWVRRISLSMIASHRWAHWEDYLCQFASREVAAKVDHSPRGVIVFSNAARLAGRRAIRNRYGTVEMDQDCHSFWEKSEREREKGREVEVIFNWNLWDKSQQKHTNGNG